MYFYLDACDDLFHINRVGLVDGLADSRLIECPVCVATFNASPQGTFLAEREQLQRVFQVVLKQSEGRTITVEHWFYGLPFSMLFVLIAKQTQWHVASHNATALCCSIFMLDGAGQIS